MAETTPKTYPADKLQAVLRAHLAWLRNEIDGVQADLRGAILRGAILRDVNIRGAILSGAILSDAILSDVILSDAILRDAILSDADLRGAILRGAILRGANELDTAIMPGGYTFAVYTSELLPALLTAADVVNSAWDCHQWTNYPMAFAFGVNEIDHIPILHRDNALLFIQLFDANLLPRPEIPEGEAVPA